MDLGSGSRCKDELMGGSAHPRAQGLFPGKIVTMIDGIAA